MISQRLRIFLHDIIHHLLVLCAALLFLAAVGLSLLHWLLPFLPQYENLVTSAFSQLIGASVQFDSMQVGWHNLQPEIDLQGVRIENVARQTLMRIPQVDLRLSLMASLTERKPVISLLQIKQWQVRAYQNDQAQWRIAGIESLPSTQPTENNIQANNFFSALLQIHHLKLAECNIDIAAQNQPRIVLTHTNLDWLIKSHALAIYGNTIVQGPSSTPLQYAVELQGDDAQLLTHPASAKLYFNIGSLAVAPWLTKINWHDLQWQQGTLKGQLWANWQKDHWQQAAANLQLHDLRVTKHTDQKTWQIKSAQTKLTATWQEKKLTVQMQSQAGSLLLGTLFRDEMPFAQMALAGTWQRDTPDDYQLLLNTADIQTGDAHIHAQLKLIGAAQKSTEMNLLAHIDMPAFNHISHYLPAGIMSPGLVHWLDRAIVRGKSLQADMLWRGPLDHFPFHDQSGTMQIAGQVQGVTLDYALGWPKISDIDAHLYFTSHGMHIQSSHGLLADMPISQVAADIPFQSNTAVSIQGMLDTDLKKAWSFLTASKLKQTLAPLLNHLDATGPAHISLNLTIPLSSGDEVGYQGQVLLNHDQFTMQDTPVQITDLTGNVDFSNHTLTGALLGKWFDKPWQITLDKKPTAKNVQIDFSGLAPLDQWVNKNFAFAKNWFSGQSPMNGQITISTDEHPNFSLQILSDLKGLAIKIPFGMNKNAEDSTPFQLALNTLADATLQLSAKWLSPQGPITVSNDHDHWSIHTPLTDAQLVEPNAAQDFWQINIADLDLSHWDDYFSQDMDLNKPIPAMNIQATRLRLPSMFIPSLTLALRPKENGTSIKNLLLRTDQFTITAQGTTDNQPLHTALKGSLTTSHLDNALTALGFGDLVDADRASIHFNLVWPGALWQFDRKQLSGDLNFTTHEGVFKNLSAQTNNKINLGRMLSLLSVQALSQHLTSHFSDKGFTFTGVAGQLQVTPNHLNQIHVAIHGTVAEVLLQGCVNLQDQQLNLVTKINPNVTGSLPVLAALAGGPILGALGFVANQFLEPMVGKLSESYYAVQGPEHDPKTNKVNRIQAGDILRACA